MRMDFSPLHRLVHPGWSGGKSDRGKKNQRNFKLNFLVFFNNLQDVKDAFSLKTLTDIPKHKLPIAFFPKFFRLFPRTFIIIFSSFGSQTSSVP